MTTNEIILVFTVATHSEPQRNLSLTISSVEATLDGSEITGSLEQFSYIANEHEISRYTAISLLQHTAEELVELVALAEARELSENAFIGILNGEHFEQVSYLLNSGEDFIEIDSWEEYAEELYLDTEPEIVEALDRFPYLSLDADKVARDMALDYNIFDCPAGNKVIIRAI